MAIPLVEFSIEGYKIRKIFGFFQAAPLKKNLGRNYPKKSQVAPYKNLGRFYRVYPSNHFSGCKLNG